MHKHGKTPAFGKLKKGSNRRIVDSESMHRGKKANSSDSVRHCSRLDLRIYHDVSIKPIGAAATAAATEPGIARQARNQYTFRNTVAIQFATHCIANAEASSGGASQPRRAEVSGRSGVKGRRNGVRKVDVSVLNFDIAERSLH